MTIEYYAVFGNPISHSKSPKIQKKFAEQTKQNLLYNKKYIKKKIFKKTLQAFKKQGGKGLNITIPFKLEAYKISNILTKRAKQAGAVNTITFKKNNIIGDNTDGDGFIKDIIKNKKWNIKNKNILILGSGGAVRGILAPLLKENPNKIYIANRTISKAIKLENSLKNSNKIKAIEYKKLTQYPPMELIINGTNTSLNDTIPPIKKNIINKNTCCYDMMYSKNTTSFIKFVKKNNCIQYSDGLGMLIEQAALSFKTWRYIYPNTSRSI